MSTWSHPDSSAGKLHRLTTSGDRDGEEFYRNILLVLVEGGQVLLPEEVLDTLADIAVDGDLEGLGRFSGCRT